MRTLPLLYMVVSLVSAAACAASSAAADPPPMKLPDLKETTYQWQPGVDYFVLFSPREPLKKPGKVEVMVRHQVTVRECREFEPALQAWIKNKPDFIEVVRKPHIHYPHARWQARMFLTLQQMGKEELAVTKLYDWMWDKARYRIYHNLYHPDGPAIDRLNLEFVKANGIDEKAFSEIYSSPKMDEAVTDAEADSLWDGDATVVINSRYATDFERTAHGDPKLALTEGNYARFFKLVEGLAAAELRAMNESAAAGKKP